MGLRIVSNIRFAIVGYARRANLAAKIPTINTMYHLNTVRIAILFALSVCSTGHCQVTWNGYFSMHGDEGSEYMTSIPNEPLILNGPSYFEVNKNGGSHRLNGFLNGGWATLYADLDPTHMRLLGNVVMSDLAAGLHTGSARMATNWSTQITLTNKNASYVSGWLTASMYIEGAIWTLTNGQANVTYALAIEPGGTSSTFETDIGGRYSGTFVDSQTLTVRVPFTLAARTSESFALGFAQTGNLFAPAHSSAYFAFGDSVIWDGISLTDVDGNILDGVSISSPSGIDFAKSYREIPSPAAVPEPSATGISASIVLTALVYIRKRGTRSRQKRSARVDGAEGADGYAKAH